MTTDEEIIRLLTEIRDKLQDESDWRRKAIEESARLQRLGIIQHRIALTLGSIAILAGVLFLIYYIGLFKK